MLFNNFVEGSLKLKPFDVHITQTIVKKIKMKAFIFFLQIAQLIETSYLYIYIFSYKFFSNPSTHQIFLISIFLEAYPNPRQIFQKFYNYLRITITFSIPPILNSRSTLLQLPPTSLQNPSKIIHLHPIIQTSSRQTSYKKPPRTLTPKP